MRPRMPFDCAAKNNGGLLKRILNGHIQRHQKHIKNEEYKNKRGKQWKIRGLYDS